MPSQPHICFLVKYLVYLLFVQCYALAFDFSFSAPSQCDDFTISWSGGRAPFFLLITPMFDVSQNISIPDSAYDANSQKGSYTTQLTLAAGTQFLLTMSDGSGFGTGGISALLTAGSSQSGASCNTTQQPPDFLFQLNTALQQCRTYTFSAYNDAVQPVRIIGLIPLGQAFELLPPVGPTSFDWLANVAGGTSITFLMMDSKGGHGGSSDMKVVGWSDRSDCLDASSPRSTVTNSATATPTSSSTQGGASVSPGAIAGAVIGGCAAMGLIFVLAFCVFLRKRDRKLRRHSDEKGLHPDVVSMMNSGNGNRNTTRVSRALSTLFPNQQRMMRTTVDLRAGRPPLSDTSSGTVSMPRTSDYEPNPFILPSAGSVATMGHSDVGSGVYHNHSSRSRSQPISSSRSSYNDRLAYPSMVHSSSRSTHHNRRPSVPVTSVSGTTSRKASMLGAPVSPGYPRLVLHTDAEDAQDGVDGPDSVVELPPQYADRRLTVLPPSQMDSQNPSYASYRSTSSPPPPPPPTTP